MAALVVVVGWELQAQASNSGPVPAARLTVDTPAWAIGVTRFDESDTHRKNSIHYATGVGFGFDAPHSPHAHVGTASDLTLYWGDTDDSGDGRAGTRLLEALLRVELRGGATWWAGSRVRIDHELGLGPCFDYFGYDASVRRSGVGLAVSLRNTVDWRAWDRMGLIAGPVLIAARRLDRGGPSVRLRLAELRLGVTWELE